MESMPILILTSASPIALFSIMTPAYIFIYAHPLPPLLIPQILSGITRPMASDFIIAHHLILMSMQILPIAEQGSDLITVRIWAP
jgi:hypothetical protein